MLSKNSISYSQLVIDRPHILANVTVNNNNSSWKKHGCDFHKSGMSSFRFSSGMKVRLTTM